MDMGSYVSNPIDHLQKRLQDYYHLYQKGHMSEKEYLMNIKPIDREINHLEMDLFRSYYLQHRSITSPPS